ncbi:hypothetical protein V1507DRAFT_449226 [Lipomyces tetrasporus]
MISNASGDEQIIVQLVYSTLRRVVPHRRFRPSPILFQLLPFGRPFLTRVVIHQLFDVVADLSVGRPPKTSAPATRNCLLAPSLWLDRTTKKATTLARLLEQKHCPRRVPGDVAVAVAVSVLSVANPWLNNGRTKARGKIERLSGTPRQWGQWGHSQTGRCARRVNECRRRVSSTSDLFSYCPSVRALTLDSLSSNPHHLARPQE